MLSGISGLIVLTLFGSNIYCLGLGVGLAIFIMMITNTVHPPAGGNPLIVILSNQGVSFILIPLAATSLVIILFAVFYNKITGRSYPIKR